MPRAIQAMRASWPRKGNRAAARCQIFQTPSVPGYSRCSRSPICRNSSCAAAKDTPGFSRAKRFTKRVPLPRYVHFAGSNCHHGPDLNFPRVAEIGRHHANDGCRLSIERDLAVYDVWIAAENLLPRRVTEDGGLGHVGPVVDPRERASNKRTPPEYVPKTFDAVEKL